MLALTILDHVGIIGGALLLVLGLIMVLRPFKIHVTVRHESDHSEDEKEE